jgi:hypothetical protein
MIVYTGSAGARYNPATDSWRSINLAAAPDLTAPPYDLFWTGSEMLAFGGLGYSGRYNPATDTWRPVSSQAIFFPSDAPAVWTGCEMVKWGGRTGAHFYSVKLARYCASPAVSNSEIVLYASEASRIVGNWQVVPDVTAAGGVRIWNPDQGVPKVAASPNPANYFEISFDAPAGRLYHLWARLKAQSDSYNNDSAYFQFSDSVNQNGEVAYRIGTTSFISTILEDCTGAGVQGWGWADNEWCGTGVNIYFQTSGRHTLRVQQREDGVSIDQIVLSPQTYLRRSPGTLKNDATILPKNTSGF